MVYLIKYQNLNLEEQSLAISLTGFLNKHHISTIVDYHIYRNYVDDELEEIDLFDLIDKYHTLIEGIILFDLKPGLVDINLATNLMLLGNYLSVPRTILSKIQKYNFPIIYDTKEIVGSIAKRQDYVFNLVKDIINKDALIHQVTRADNFLVTLRDQAIKDNILCIYTQELDEDINFRHKVLEYLNKNIPIYGWNDNEIAFIADISKYGDYMIPADWSCNHSYFSSFTGPLKQKNKERTKIDPQKHYVCITVSDGDNIQWMETHFLTSSTMYERMESKENYKLNFTFPPLLRTNCYNCAKKIYEVDKNNYFISGVSGVGYMNPSRYPKKYLPQFAIDTASSMKTSDLSIITILDNLNETDEANLIDSLSYFAGEENIEGGILELDPDRYEAGKGRVYFINDKPFASVRFSLWGSNTSSNKELLDDYIKQINKMKPDIESPNGYSVINFHPWSMHIKDLDYVVSKLAKHIEIVYAFEFINFMKENIKR